MKTWSGWWMGIAMSCFVLELAAWGADSPVVVERSFTNSTPIQLLDDGPADPYPSSISVSGMTGVVSRVSVTLYGLSHSFPDDLDVLLVTPTGRKLVLMSDAGGSFPIDGADVTLADGFPAIPNTGEILTGSYGPANWGLGMDLFPGPAPPGPLSVGLTNANGTSPNGDWLLFVFDDALVSEGVIERGWALTVTAVDVIPELTAVRQGQTVQLSWSSAAMGFALESRPQLERFPSWTSVTNAPVATNGQNRVTLPLSPGEEYFRLRR